MNEITTYLIVLIGSVSLIAGVIFGMGQWLWRRISDLEQADSDHNSMGGR